MLILRRAHGCELIGERSRERLRESQLAPFVLKGRNSGGSPEKLGNEPREPAGLGDGIGFHGGGLKHRACRGLRPSE